MSSDSASVSPPPQSQAPRDVAELDTWTLRFKDADIEAEFRASLAGDVVASARLYALGGIFVALLVTNSLLSSNVFYADLSVAVPFILYSWFLYLCTLSQRGLRHLERLGLRAFSRPVILVTLWVMGVAAEFQLRNPGEWENQRAIDYRTLFFAMGVLVVLQLFLDYLLFVQHAALTLLVTASACGLAAWKDPGDAIIFVGLPALTLHWARHRERTSRAVFLLLRQLHKEKITLEGLTISNGADVLSIFSKRKHETGAAAAAADPVWMIASDQLTLDKQIGQGSYGAVHVGRWRGTQVAIKQISPDKQDRGAVERHLRDFLGEVSLLAELRHPNIVLFMGVSLDGGQAQLVTEYMNGGSLFDAVHRQGGAQLSALAKLSAMAQAASGLAYLHSLTPAVLHGDFKTGNVLVDDRWNVKIADFGMSFVFSAQSAAAGSSKAAGAAGAAEDAEDAEDAGRYGKGTLVYAAPEVLRSDAVSVQADVYSLGIVMWEVSQQEVPYSELFQQCGAATVSVLVLEKKMRPDRTQGHVQGRMQMSAPYCDLMRACWAQEPASRPSARHVHMTLQSLADVEREKAGSSRIGDGYTTATPSSIGGGARSGAMSVAIVEVIDAGSLWERDARKARRALRDVVLPALRTSLEAHGGMTRRSWPGGVEAVFSRGQRALKWATQLQQRMQDATTVAGRIDIRIGLHSGMLDDDCDEDGDEPTAGVIAQARRVVTLARAGEVAVSDAFVDGTGFAEDFDLRLDGGWRAVGTCSAQVGSMRILQLRTGADEADEADEDFEALGREAEAAEGPEWLVQARDVTGEEPGTTVSATTTARRALFMGAAVSVKRITGVRSEEMQLLFYEHCQMMQTARHVHVAPFVGAWTHARSGIVVQQWLARSLAEYLLTESREVVQAASGYILGGVADGLAFLHGLGIVHRAIHTGNVLFDDEGTVKIADAEPGVVSAAEATRTTVGELVIEAPEVLAGGQRTGASDMFLFGLLSFEVVVGRRGFERADGRVAAAVGKGLRPAIPTVVDKERRELIEGAWEGDAARRWSAAEARDAARSW